MHVYRSMIIDAPITKVWAAIREFDSVVDWNPGVASAVLENGLATQTGTVRALKTPDGAVFRETLLAHSDVEHFYTYDILDSPLPVSGYVSTHRLVPITQSGQTLGIWESWFDCAPEVAGEMEKVVGDVIYVGGMTGLNDFMKERTNG